jgi:hypothetical protein
LPAWMSGALHWTMRRSYWCCWSPTASR